MKTPSKKRQGASKPAPTPRRYDSPVRQQQSAETLERILATGAELVRDLLEWDLNRLTAREIGARAGISERTVKRYFPTDRKLHDAVMQRLVEESGISLEKLQLDEFETVTTRMFEFLAAFTVTQKKNTTLNDPTFLAMDRERCNAVLAAVTDATPDWAAREQKVVAAAMDLLWSVPSYERLITSWGLEPKDAIASLTWLIRLANEAIQRDKKPDAGE